MTPEREAELNNTGSNLTWEEGEECMVAIAELRERAEKAEAEAMLANGLLVGFKKEADGSLAKIQLLEDQWMKAAFTFRKHHKAVTIALEKM